MVDPCLITPREEILDHQLVMSPLVGGRRYERAHLRVANDAKEKGKDMANSMVGENRVKERKRER